MGPVNWLAVVLAAIELLRRGGGKPVRVGAVNDLDEVAAMCQLVRQSLHEDAVAAETVRRVERRDHAEAEGTVHGSEKSDGLDT